MTKFTVPDMSCGHCKKAIEGAIHGLDANARITVDLEARTVEVSGAPGDDAILAALQSEGYPASPAI
jgi:copper chaperone